MADEVIIDIISDVVCPWCWIGKRRLDAALLQRPDLKVTLSWRAYQLYHDLPPEGMDRKAHIAKRFGSPEKARQIYEHITQEARAVGLDMRFERIKRSPNTVDAHRLLRWAKSADCQNAVAEDLFNRFFHQGDDISRREILIDVAVANGMSGDLVADLLDQGRDMDLVRQEIAAARQMGVSGVPTYIFNGKYALNGAQAESVFLQVLDQATHTADAL